MLTFYSSIFCVRVCVSASHIDIEKEEKKRKRMYLISAAHTLYGCVVSTESRTEQNFHDRQEAAATADDETELSLRVKSSSSVQTNTKTETERANERKNGQKREEQAYINC